MMGKKQCLKMSTKHIKFFRRREPKRTMTMPGSLGLVLRDPVVRQKIHISTSIVTIIKATGVQANSKGLPTEATRDNRIGTTLKSDKK